MESERDFLLSLSPLVSAVIPTYNRANVISRAIRSVMTQTYRPIEIVVVDDGSEDDTSEVLLKFPGIKILAQANLGVSAARNTGIANSTGSLVAFLDSDDEWLPEKIQKQVELYTRDQPYFICHTNEIWLRNEKPVSQKTIHLKQGGYFFERALERCLISPSAAVISRALLDEVGWFDERLVAAEDYDLWLRITSCYRVDFVDEPLVIKRAGESNQLSLVTPAIDRCRIIALEKIISHANLRYDQRKAAIKTLVRKSNILSAGCRKRGNIGEATYYSELARKYSDINDEPHGD